METSASFEARSAPSSYPTSRQSILKRFSAQVGEIARDCGIICVMRGTGENHFPPVWAQDAAKVSVGK